MDLTTIAQSITTALLAHIPELLDKGWNAVEKRLFRLADEGREVLKDVWNRLSSREGGREIAELAAREPEDLDAVAALRITIRQILERDIELQRRAGELHLENITNSTVHHVTTHGGNSPVVYGTMNTTIHHGPTAKQRERHNERQKLEEILNQFDRRAVQDSMHEENICFMLRSLRELRETIQEAGISTLRSEAATVLLREIQQELLEIEGLTPEIGRLSPKDDWPDSLLDFRIFGGERRDDLSVRLPYETEKRLSDARVFIERRVHSLFSKATNVDQGPLRRREYGDPEPAERSVPLNSPRLASDIFCLYLFGRVDQLKDRIVSKLGTLRRILHNYTEDGH